MKYYPWLVVIVLLVFMITLAVQLNEVDKRARRCKCKLVIAEQQIQDLEQAIRWEEFLILFIDKDTEISFDMLRDHVKPIYEGLYERKCPTCQNE